MLARDIMRKEFLQIDGDEPVSKLIGQMMVHNERAAVVFGRQGYIGVAYARLLLRNKLHVADWKVKRVVARPAILSGNEDISEVARKMFVSDSPLLPVMGYSVQGAVFEEDLLPLMRSLFKGLKVNDVMNPAITIKERDRIGRAIEMMFEDRIERLPVVDTSGKIVGVASVTNLMQNFLLQHNARDKGYNSDIKTKGSSPSNDDMDAFEVRNCMESAIWTARRDTPLPEIVDMMQKYNVMSVPVVDSTGNVVGIFTIRDLLKKFYSLSRPGRLI
ncbi:CBS domain-containing protein [Candidatus Woesearchaeota archaeon]|nr:CBS domain-containing protein [Candidatus Woesearchaeota archaeon]